MKETLNPYYTVHYLECLQATKDPLTILALMWSRVRHGVR